jgi:iron complex outermembrane recepter protein
MPLSTAHQLNAIASRTVSAAAIGACALVSAHSASAQTAAETSDPSEVLEASEVLEEVAVTGTRVVRDGYQAPTPTSVIGADEISTKAPVNLADYLNELPSLSGSSTPRTTISAVSAGNGGINALNLRNLGVNRTLVLLDGQRVGAASLTGLIDINQFPQGLVKRVDVVTGGASADWGSDAVAGVVNFILDKDLSGLKAEGQGGITDYGDNASYKVSVTGGTGFFDNRARVLFNAEAAHNDGVSGIGSREWYNGAKLFFNPAYTPTNGLPELIARPSSGLSTATPGGIITSGPLRGTYFGEAGVPAQFNYGSVVSAPFMQGGDWQYADFATSADLDPRLSRQSFFIRSGFDVTDHLEVFAQISYGKATTRVAFGNQYNLGNITIRSDNAFIPASIAAQVTGNFSLGTFNQDLGPAIVSTDRDTWRPVIGLNGDFDALGSRWTWDVYAQRSDTDAYVSFDTTVTARYQAAIDSVRDSSGAIVCRSALTDPTNGCVPYNIFGTGVNSQAAVDYVKGTAWGLTQLTQDVVAGTLRGDPISSWAGPVSIATGFEHRREKVDGDNDPLSRTRAYFAGNYQVSRGDYEVTEGFLEAVVPLAKEQFLAESLDFNAGARMTHYSTSGDVTTWKAGLTWSPVNDLNLRVTRSRDIRAPNLSELFQAGQTVTTTFADPFRGNATATGFQLTSGNPNLKPEEADTTGLGAILRPRFLPGFTASVDYYEIEINDAIATVNAATVVSQCFAGNTVLCSQITRNSSGVIASVQVLPINLAQQIARGVDFEASYRRPLTISSFLNGDLSVRLLATHYLENYSNNGINPPTDTVGTNSQNGSLYLSLPNWRYTASVGWEQGPVEVALTARGFSSGLYNTSYIECSSGCPTSTVSNMTIEDNHLPGALYFDASFNYNLSDRSNVFLTADNILNKDPAQVAYGTSVGGAPLSVNAALYDVLGRTFRIGVRFQM